MEAEEKPSAPAADAAPKAEPQAQASTFGALAQAGVNVQLGLDYCAGDEDFYREMLGMFSGQGQAKREEIAALYESGDWPEYAVKVHALKSTSLTIGAEELSEQAKALELAGKSGDAGYILENHADLLGAYQAVCESIAGA